MKKGVVYVTMMQVDPYLYEWFCGLTRKTLQVLNDWWLRILPSDIILSVLIWLPCFSN